ncbi:hypothetical protein CHARACLAT_003887 [Characodon lateralis]|uniref:Uncharacterized protein n=1 Tax=Characodon lateralis TaxID=208331 RepID=A0ABU7DXH7_9TELE|nr:hypothetical protein [Characodon lateralis]
MLSSYGLTFLHKNSAASLRSLCSSASPFQKCRHRGAIYINNKKTDVTTSAHKAPSNCSERQAAPRQTRFFQLNHVLFYFFFTVNRKLGQRSDLVLEVEPVPVSRSI